MQCARLGWDALRNAEPLLDPDETLAADMNNVIGSEMA